MAPGSAPVSIAFEGDRCIASGTRREVVRIAKEALDRRKDASIIVFDGNTSATIEIDFRGSLADVLARLPDDGSPPVPAEVDTVSAPRGPGRPKLGVVAREVTLLPRHWEWLARQPGGASVAIRKLVEQASRTGADKDRIRQAQEAAYRFHVGHLRQQAGLRGRHPCAVRRRRHPFRKMDRRMARRHPRPHFKARGAGVRPCDTGGAAG